MRGWFRGIFLGAAIGALAAGTATAHVEVLPAEATVNAVQEFVIRVPVEGAVATTRVRVTFPKQVVVVRFATSPGWSRRTVAAADGGIGGVVYEGGRARPDEYAEFRLLATPIEPGPALWKVEQTSADGTTKPWTGPPRDESDPGAESGPSTPGPAPATRFLPAPSAGTATAKDESSPAGIWLGIVAIGIAAASLMGMGFLWSSRPMRLPPDGEPLPVPAEKRPAKRRRG